MSNAHNDSNRGDDMTKATELQKIQDGTRERMLRELASDLADLVESGDMTDEQANQWYNDKADQWNR